MEKIVIYAELSRGQYSKIVNGEYVISVPEGTRLANRAGSRGLFFYCDDENIKNVLIEALEDDAINYSVIEE